MGHLQNSLPNFAFVICTIYLKKGLNSVYTSGFVNLDLSQACLILSPRVHVPVHLLKHWSGPSFLTSLTLLVPESLVTK